jgi:hypothetical protein
MQADEKSRGNGRCYNEQHDASEHHAMSIRHSFNRWSTASQSPSISSHLRLSLLAPVRRGARRNVPLAQSPRETGKAEAGDPDGDRASQGRRLLAHGHRMR